MASSGMLRRVALVRTDVSEELSASIIRVTRICELELSNPPCCEIGPNLEYKKEYKLPLIGNGTVILVPAAKIKNTKAEDAEFLKRQ
jgi:hypothetical protein